MDTFERFDWGGLETDFTMELERFARSSLDRGGRIYAVAVWLFYQETCGRIFLPAFAASTEEWFTDWLARDRTQRELPLSRWEDLRWTPADWPYQHMDGDWRDSGAFWAWSKALTEAASGYGAWNMDALEPAARDEGHWNAVYELYLEMVVRACRGVAAKLRRERVVPDDFVVVALHDKEELLPRTVTADELRRHFPPGLWHSGTGLVD